MDLDPEIFFQRLSECSQAEHSDPKECARLLSALNNTLIREQQNSTNLDLYLVDMFNRSNGFHQFVTNVANKKEFQTSIKKIFEIIYAFINNFKYKLQKYIIQINNMVLKILKSSVVSAAEQVKALEVLILGFEKINMSLEYTEHYREMSKALLYTFSIRSSDTVKAKMLIALGTFACHFQYIVRNPDEFKELFLSQLESQSVQQHPSITLIEAAFTALMLFSESFPLHANTKNDEVKLARLYRQIDEMLFSPRRNRTTHKACFGFLSRNMSLFASYFAKEYKKWHDFLLNLLKSVSDEEIVIPVIKSFYECTANYIVEESGEYEVIAVYFFDYFKQVVQGKNYSNFEKKLSYQGLHYFAKAFYKYMASSTVIEFFASLMQTFEQTNILEKDLNAEGFDYLPEYTQAVCSLIQFKDMTHNEFVCLKRGVISMIRIFPNLSYTQHSLVMDAIVTTLFFVRNKDKRLFDSFVEYIVYQGVIWSCSHQPVHEAELIETEKQRIITVRDYLKIWKALLGCASNKTYDKLGFSLNDRQQVVVKIMKQLITTLQLLLNKLNVNLIQNENNQSMTDIQCSYAVAKTDDFIIFLNVVDFYKAILLEIDPPVMKNCICKLIIFLILKCTNHPYISGFYKLLSVWLCISNKMDYFNQSNVQSVEDVRMCYESLADFMTVLLSKIKQFKDELLIACLELLLSYPTTILKSILISCIPAFIAVFNVGKSCISLAEMGVNTLERLQNELASADMEEFLAPIIPQLDLYLQSTSIGSLNQLTDKRKVSQSLKRRRIVLEVEPELDRLQRKILSFIGQQNVFLCNAFVVNQSEVEVESWDSKQRLKVVLPYQDAKLDLYLDKLVPRIVHLALYCNNEKIRLTACELLHATVLVFLGTTKPMTKSALTDLNDLLKNMTYPLLQLGCDLDQTIQKLFQPLVFETIHWYTHPSQIGSEHCAIFLEAVMEGITHATDSAVRDFSCKCVNEFVKWSIKQNPSSNLADDIIIKSLLKKMQFFSTHPDSCKKMGAALIFNNIYRELLDETSLMSSFWFEYLHLFVKSLSLVDSKVEDDHVTVQISQALSHIRNGFISNAAVFNEKDRRRRVPADFNGDLLKDAALWILVQTKSRNLHCRSQCMDLFCTITPHTSDFISMPEFMERNFTSTDTWIRDIYDEFLTEFPENLLDTSILVTWMQSLLIAVDGYCFVIRNNLVDNCELLSPTVINSLQYFLSSLSSASIENVLKLDRTVTVLEKKEYKDLQFNIVIKTIQLLDALLTNTKYSKNVDQFYTTNLWNLIRDFFFDPQVLGSNRLLNSSDQIVHGFLNEIPPNQLAVLKQILTDYISSTNFADVDLKRSIPLKCRNAINGLHRLQKLNIELNVQFCAGLADKLLNKFVTIQDSGVILADKLQDSTLAYCLSMLSYALNDSKEFEVFVNYLYLPCKVQCWESKELICFGIYILQLFEDVAVKNIVKQFDAYVTLILNQKQFMNDTVEHLLHILKFVNNRRDLKDSNQSVVKVLVQKWHDFEFFFNGSFSNTEKGIMLMGLILPVCDAYKVDCGPLKWWLYHLLMHEISRCKEDAKLDFCVDVFSLLSTVVNCEDGRCDDVRSKLSHLEAYFMSLPTFGKKEHLLIKLWLSAPKIKSSELFTFLLDIYVFLSDEALNFNLKDILMAFIAKADRQLQLKLISDIHTKCSESDLPPAKKYKLLTSTLALYQNCNDNVFEQFFVQNISKMMEVLQTPTTADNLMAKTTQFVLFELLFFRISILPSASSPSAIVTAYSPAAQNKELVSCLLQYTFNAFRETVTSGFVRLYRCHVYNCMVSLVTNSIKNAAYYSKLFNRQHDNEDILWRNLIDTDQTYSFTKGFDSIPKRTTLLVNIRSDMRKQKLEQNQFSQPKKYVESMRVYHSSLCEDITAYDFTNVTLRTEIGEDASRKQHFSQQEVEIELVDVNTHECMATVCGLIRHIAESDVLSVPKTDEEFVLPAWLQAIRSLLLRDDTHKNIKIFWLKVIDNTSAIFKNYAKWFLQPLLKCLVDKCAGPDINYFTADIVALLASWANTVIPGGEQETALVTEFISFLIEKIDNERRDTFKYHLELVRLIVEAWKSCIVVPYDLVYSKVNVDHTSKSLEVGIHISSIFLANNLKLWRDGDHQKFISKLFQICMHSTHKTVYKPTAEILGLLLKVTSGEPYFEKICNNVNVMFKKVNDLDKYALCLEAIALHFPAVVSEFHLRKLLGQIRLIPCALIKTYLKIFLKNPRNLEYISDFKVENWDSYLDSEDTEVQILATELVHSCDDILRQSDGFMAVVRSLCKNVVHPDVMCRSRTFDIIIHLVQSEPQYKNKHSDAYELCQNALIQGLIDSNDDIRGKVLEYWETTSTLPVEASNRFARILADLYKPDTENNFLNYCCYLLLSSIKKAADYKQSIFEYPLEDCDFEEYKLAPTKRTLHQSLVPMFAETLSSTVLNIDTLGSNQSMGSQASKQSGSWRQIISTQSNLFFQVEEQSGILTEDEAFKPPPLPQTYRRRFQKDKVKVKLEARKWVKEKERQRYFAQGRQDPVMLKANYRKGDFPDVQICLATLIDTLQALTLYDYEICQILYLKMFTTITSKMDNETTFMITVCTAIKSIFQRSNQFNTALFKTLFDMILTKKLKFEPELIASVSRSSGHIIMGIILLEELLISYDDHEPCTSKRLKGVESAGEILYWLKLAELYKEIEEWDVVKAIFWKEVDSNERVQGALLAESRKEWRTAQDYYKQLLEVSDTSDKREFYCESYFKCFAHLGEWDSLSATIDNFVSDPSSSWKLLWDQDWNRRKLLPWYIGAKAKEIVIGCDSRSHFFEQLNDILNSNNADYLRNHFSEELCILWVLKGEVDEAKQNLIASVNAFLHKWQSLNPLYLNLRYNNLLKLRNFIDIKKFITVYENVSIDSEDEINKLLNYWNTTSNEQLPSILLNETRVLYRQQFAKSLIDKLKSVDADEDVVEQLNNMQNKLAIELVNVAIEQNNYFMARKYYKMCDPNSSALKYSYGKLACIKAQLMTNAQDKVDALIQSIKIIAPLLDPSQDIQLRFQTCLLQFSNFEAIVSLVLNNNMSVEVLQKLQPFVERDAVLLPAELLVYGATKLGNFLNEHEQQLGSVTTANESSKHRDILSEAYLRLAYFAQNSRTIDFTYFISYILRAMKWGSAEARQLFPCIFMERHLNEEEKKLFIEEKDHVPLWMFLGWIPQLLIQIDSPNVSIVSSIIVKMSEMYPQAVSYPYRLSKETFTFADPQFREAGLQLIEKLDKILLSNKTIDLFVQALSFVSVPAVILDYYVNKLIGACTESNENKFKIIHQQVLDIFGSVPQSKDFKAMQGNMFGDLHKQCKSKIQSLLASSPDHISSTLRNLKTVLTTMKTDKKSVLLKDYSPWLANFLPHKINLDLEIPGQYTGDRMPLVEHHIKIFSFHPNVHVLHSKTFPIKIVILGHDTKEYPFLIKFGEDLRQDQRIEQLFVLMNGIFRHDPDIQRDLSVVTYKVVPLKSNLGMIEWIADTTLDKFASKMFTDEEAWKLSFQKYCQLYHQLANGPAEQYGTAALTCSRDRIISNYRNVVAMIPVDIFKSGLWHLSPNAESFFVLRNNFITSYAVMFVSNWILGIGDRHLGNILICTKTGRVIGIDFGYAFGIATQFLPVPELVPCRLTPHVVNVMEPLGEKGLFRDVMIHALGCLRKNKGALLATMKVFIDEPSIDWLEYASKTQDGTTSKLEWYPAKKIDQVRRKLDGANSTAILIQDLTDRLNTKLEFKEAYINLVRGVSQYDLRARKNDDLSVEDQVDCLIDHATDYNLLGRMHEGWGSWI